MFFKMLNLGNMDNNCYILGDDKSKHALLIDAPAEAGAILDVLEDEGLKLKFVLLTHCHYDHIGAAARLAQRFVVMDSARILMEGTPREVFARADGLTKAGLDVPQVTRVLMRLRERGIDIGADAYTPDAASAAEKAAELLTA